MAITNYESIKNWRYKYPERRQADKKRNYDLSLDDAYNSGNPWTKDEDKQVIEHLLSDRDLGKELGRSTRAIQQRRWRLQRSCQ